MLRRSREDISGKTKYPVKDGQNIVILPNYLVKAHNIKPHDTIGLIGWRAKNCAAIAFEVQVHQQNHTITIPDRIMEFCGFGPGDTASFKIVRVRHKSNPRKKRRSLPRSASH